MLVAYNYPIHRTIIIKLVVVSFTFHDPICHFVKHSYCFGSRFRQF